MMIHPVTRRKKPAPFIAIAPQRRRPGPNCSQCLLSAWSSIWEPSYNISLHAFVRGRSSNTKDVREGVGEDAHATAGGTPTPQHAKRARAGDPRRRDVGSGHLSN